MSSVFIRLGVGGSVYYKDDVATSANLPLIGNTIGDIRATVDTRTFYMWDGSAWQAMTGGGGGGTPGSPTSSIQFNNAGAFGGDAQFLWDNIGKVLNLNGLSISPLKSSVTLIDNQSSPLTAFSYSASTFNYSVIEYSITRSTSKEVGFLFVANDASTASIAKAFTDLNSVTGITFSVIVSGGNVLVQYTSTATGNNGTLKYALRQWV